MFTISTTGRDVFLGLTAAVAFFYTLFFLVVRGHLKNWISRIFGGKVEKLDKLPRKIWILWALLLLFETILGILGTRTVDNTLAPPVLISYATITSTPTSTPVLTSTPIPSPSITPSPLPTDTPTPTPSPTYTPVPLLEPITVDNVSQVKQIDLAEHGGKRDDRLIRSLLWLDTEYTLLSVSLSDIFICELDSTLQADCVEIEKFSDGYKNVFSRIKTRDIDFIANGTGGLLAAAATNGNLVIWKADFSEDPTLYEDIIDGDIISLSWLQDAENLLLGVAQDKDGLHGILRRFEPAAGKDALFRLETDNPHLTWVMDIDRASTTDKYASVSTDGILKIWNGFQMLGSQFYDLNDLRIIHTIAWSPDSSLIAAGDQPGRIILFTSSGVDTPRLIANAIPSSSPTIGSCSVDEENENVKQFHSDAVLALTWSDTGLLASGSSDGTVLFWDTSTWTAIHCINFDNNENDDIDVTSLEFSHDSKGLAIGLSTGQVLMYYASQN
ncbi:MAG: hypothetical protein JXA33_08410 [Anaerolineae bacterium]|nr:hypothetical protein [Anaerolineae bacterium]